MSDTDNWPLLRAELKKIGWSFYVPWRRGEPPRDNDKVFCYQGAGWRIWLGSRPRRFVNRALEQESVELKTENEAIAWARANLGREQ